MKHSEQTEKFRIAKFLYLLFCFLNRFFTVSWRNAVFCMKVVVTLSFSLILSCVVLFRFWQAVISAVSHFSLADVKKMTKTKLPRYY